MLLSGLDLQPAILACILYEGNESQGKSGKQGRSFESGSQIFSGFVQAKTAARYFPGEFVNIVDIVGFSPESVPTSCNMQANCWGY